MLKTQKYQYAPREVLTIAWRRLNRYLQGQQKSIGKSYQTEEQKYTS